MAAEIPDGCVLIARAIFNSSLWTMPDTDRILAITLIGIANWQDKKWFDGERDIVIKRGELVRSLDDLAESARLSVRKVRTSLEHLEKVGFLTRKPTRRYTHVTLCKYDHYQTLSKYSDTTCDTAVTRIRQMGDTQVTRPRHDGDNKQESYKGEEGKEGKELSARNGSVESHVIAAWNKGPGFPITHQQGQRLVRAYIDSGVTAEKQLELVSNQPACKGKKYWEVVEPHRPKNGDSVPSINELLDQWAREKGVRNEH